MVLVKMESKHSSRWQLKEDKATTYTKELDYNNFHGSAGWLDQWKKGK